MQNAELVTNVNEAMELTLPVTIEEQEMRHLLAEFINHLIETDFQRLITILYRIDVSEKKLKEMLSLSEGIDAGNIIAELILERQLQKLKQRKDFPKNNMASDEEKW